MLWAQPGQVYINHYCMTLKFIFCFLNFFCSLLCDWSLCALYFTIIPVMVFEWLEHLYCISFQILEDNILRFVKDELKQMQKVMSSDYPEWLGVQKQGEDQDQRRISREALVKIVLHFLRRMKQEELADRLQSSKRISLENLPVWMGCLLMVEVMEKDTLKTHWGWQFFDYHFCVF